MQKIGVSRAFTMSEVLVAMGIIGVLCVTMLTLNNFSNRDYRVAQTQLLQIDGALKSWGKAITKSDETGLGATLVAKNQTTLNNSLSEYLNHTNNKISGSVKVSDGNIYGDNSNIIHLNNGTEVTVVYNTKGNAFGDNALNNSGLVATKEQFESPLAILIAEVPVGHSNDTPLSEEYVVTASGVKSLSQLYEGWDLVSIVNIPTGEKNPADGSDVTKPVFCTNASICGGDDGCKDNPSACYPAPTDIESTIQKLYINNKTTTSNACADGENGSIKNVTIGNAFGIYNLTINTCCTSPKTAVGFNESTGAVICACNQKTSPVSAGYGFKDNDACQAPCSEGSYSAGGVGAVCSLCAIGHYCPADTMIASTDCPKGSYCPNSKDKKVDTNYHTDKYVKNDKGEVTDVKDGGLKKAVTCPKGSYCPDCSSDNEGCTKDGHRTKPIECPMGTYCPNDGMTEPIKCPAGTYGIKSGAKSLDEGCKKCTAGTYQDEVGQTSCKTCTGAGLFSKEGATVCSTCPAGTYLNNGTCSPCQKGHYCPGGGLGKLPCAAGTYQDKEGQTSCKPCDCGYYQDQKGQAQCEIVAAGSYPVVDESSNDYVTSGAISFKPCPAGYYCTGLCHNKIVCPISTYQNETGQKECKVCPAGHYCPTIGMTNPTACECGTYQDLTKQTSCKAVVAGHYPTKKVNNADTYTNTAATASTNCPAGSYCQGGCNNKIACPIGHKCPTAGMSSPTACECGTYQDKTGQLTCGTVGEGYYATKKVNNIDTYTNTAATNRTICPTGHSCAGACSDKVPCPTGTYQNQTGQTTCKTCTIGHYCPTTGMTTPTACSVCTYQDLTGQTACKTISTGYYATAGGKYASSAATAQTICPKGHKCLGSNNSCDATACPAGTYQNSTGQTTCLTCAAGTSQSQNGASSCNVCSCGTYAKAGATQCTKCAAGSYSSQKSASCTQVGSGYTTTANQCDYIKVCPRVYNWAYGSWQMTATRESCSCPTIIVYQGGDSIDGFWATGDGYWCAGLRYYNSDPVILDLKGDGIKLTSAEDGVKFDIDADSEIEQTAWTVEQKEFDDAFLCLDKNGNGKIDDGSELFGDQQGAKTGLDELAKYDDNHDGVINREDKVYEQLLLWVDFNKNGITDNGELRKLSEEKITEVSTKYETETDEDGNITKDEHGNTIGIKGTFKKVLDTGEEVIGNIINAFFKIISVVTDFIENIVDTITGQ